jgi:hypothetical protein
MSEPKKNNPIDALEVKKRELEIEKLVLEKEKIGLENEELRKKFWKRNPQVWGFWTTVFVSLGSVVYLTCNGTLSKKDQELRTERKLLQLDTKELTIEKKTIYDSIVILKVSKELTSDSLRKFSDSLQGIKSQLDLALSQRKELEGIIIDLSSKIRSENQIMASLVKTKQELEKTMNDTIQKLQNNYNIISTKLLIENGNVEKMSRSVQSTVDKNNESLLAMSRKHSECIESNKKLIEEIETLKKKNQ